MDDREIVKKSLLEIQELKKLLREKSAASHENIAVIGMACRFPGGINNVYDYWRVIANKESVINEPTERRFSNFDDENPYVRKGGYLDENIEKFDSMLFKISPEEASRMDPQQKLFMKVCYEALEDSGYQPDSLRGGSVGVYAGVSLMDYAHHLNELRKTNNDTNPRDVTGAGFSFLSGRTSYYFGFHGASLTIDTACSSSLVCVHEACKGIINGDCDLALAGGVNILYSLETTKLLAEMNILSPDCSINTFDSKANGTVRGEGCGAVLLKRLSEAKKDGDKILAVIRGSAVNQDGMSSGLTAPYGPAQESLIKKAWEKSGVTGEDIDYIETHGTGTKLGDSIEIASIGRMIDGEREKPVYLGAVKTNIGHLEAASGVAGLIKVVLMLNNRIIPGAAGFEKPSEKIEWDKYNLRVPMQNIDWCKPGRKKRTAGVSSFGLSGTNAHVVLEEPDENFFDSRAEEGNETCGTYTIKLSSPTHGGLVKQVQALNRMLEEEYIPRKVNLRDMEYSLNISKADFQQRLVVRANAYQDLKASLEQLSEGMLAPCVKYGSGRKKVVFVFTGQGSQYPGMFKNLYETNSVFAGHFDKCSLYYRKLTSQDLKEVIFEGKQDLSNTCYTQPALFAVEYSFAKTLTDLGVTPEIMLGHSIGEYVACCIAGVFTLSDAIRLVAERGRLMSMVPGKMAAVFAGRNYVAGAVDGKYENVYIAASNSGEQTVVAGNENELDKFCEEMESNGIKTVILNVKHPFHSPYMRKAVPEFREALQRVQFSNPSIDIVSNITGKAENTIFTGIDYWINHLLSEVRFFDCVMALKDENAVFVEIGPKAVLSEIIRKVTEKEDACVFGKFSSDGGSQENLKALLCDLYVRGSNVLWRKYYKGLDCRLVRVPGYVFDEKALCAGSENVRCEEKERQWKVKKDAAVELTSLAETRDFVRSEICRALGMEDGEIKDDDNLLMFGMDSIIIIKKLSLWQSLFRVNLSTLELIKNSTVKDWSQILWDALNAPQDGGTTVEAGGFRVRKDKRYEEFSLNEIQYAYCIGRNEAVKWGGTGCYAYFEIDMDALDIEKFRYALTELTKRHDMLRDIISPEGTQKIQPELEIPFKMYCKGSAGSMDKHLADIREEMSYQVLPLGKAMFDVRVTEISENSYRIHFGIDFMIADAMSLQIFWNDLFRIYSGEKLTELEATYKDYLAYREEKKNSRHYEASKNYWLSKAGDFPEGPKLPVKNAGYISSRGKFVRKKACISWEDWNRFVSNSAKHQLTPSAAMLSLYSEVLSAWGAGKSFAIMLTVFERENVHPQMEEIIGDFTKLMLLEVRRDATSVRENALKIQERMQQDMLHSDYSAIDFVKEINRNQDRENTIYPVVFTSAIGVKSHPLTNNVFYKNTGFSLSSTPQVWLDFQLYSGSEGIIISWDSMEELFCENVIEDMFSKYCELVRRAIEDESIWNTCLSDMRPRKQAAEHNRANATEKPVENVTLFGGILENAHKYPDRDAIIFKDKKYSYSELVKKARQISHLLMRNNVGKGDYVLVQMKKSFEQIAAILGIVRMGAVYVPMLSSQPVDRTLTIMNKVSGKVIVVDENLKDSFGEGIVALFVSGMDESQDEGEHGIDPQALAYVIFTSGSAGMPKGVCITHKAAMNTICDVNERYNVDSSSRILGLSSISFDLSVYDIFGLLSAGGTLVLPDEDERTDPGAWSRLSEKYKITLWNSVPALLELYLDWLIRHEEKDDSLKRIILSGDWIPLGILEKLHKAVPGAKLTSMGGATEASIWSNYYDVERIKEEWSSIPYGYPLSNQGFHVLDEFGRPCPDWVEGRMHIYGKGVSEGYLNDKELTDRAFIINKNTGERMYNTDDFGRYTTGGAIEFLGRRDAQIKINGFRVELGEIENQIVKTGLVGGCVAAFHKKSENEKYILAYYTPKEMDAGEDKEPFKAVSEKAKQASEILPEDITPEEFKAITDILEEMSLGIMVNAFLGMKVLTAENPILSIDHLVNSGIVHKKYRKLLTQWADSLVQYGYIVKESLNYKAKAEVGYVDIGRFLEAAGSYEHIAYWKDSLEFLILCNKSILEILRADVNPLTMLFQEGTTRRAENFYRYNPVANYNNNIVSEAISQYADRYSGDHTVRILEFGAGTGGTTAEILKKIKGKNVKYTYTDLSTFFTSKAQEQFAEYDFIEYGLYNIDKYPVAQGYEYGSYDIIIGANVLHDAKKLDVTLKYMRSLLTNEGMLIILELTANKLFYKVSIGLIEGFSGYEDERLASNEPLLSVEQWKEKFELNKFSQVCAYPGKDNPARNFEQHVIFASAGNNVRYASEESIKSEISKNLPYYMLPYKIYAIDDIPLSSNAKVNRSLLPVPDFSKKDIVLEPCRNETEETLYGIFKEVLKISELGTNQNLFEIGGDSLKAIQMVTKMKEKNMNVTLADVFNYPTVKQLAEYVESNAAEKGHSDIAAFSAEPVKTREKFVLSRIQQAYLMGRSKEFDLGNISCHYYVELETELDMERFERSLNKVIKHQPAMRTVIYKEGYQQVLDHVEEYRIEVTDISGLNDFQKQIRIENYRNEASHTMFKLGQWPFFRFRAMKLSDHKHMLFADIDVMIADAASFYILGRELVYYYNHDAPLQDFSFEFSDYLKSLDHYRKSELYAEDKKYWLEKAEDFPPAIALPSKNSLRSIETPKFKRLSAAFDKGQWENLKKLSARNGVTPAVAICCAYCKILSYFCNQERYAINLTIFNRYGFYESINDLMGDFTSTILLDINMRAGMDFWKQAKEMQAVFAESMDHRSYDGIDFIKELSRKSDTHGQTVIPAIFTCAIFDNQVKGWKEIGLLKYAISQTSQVLLDNQITVLDGELTVVWDYVENVLDGELINEMYSTYISLLTDICSGDEVTAARPEKFHELPHGAGIHKNPDTEAFFNQIENNLNSDGLALIENEIEISYKELDSMSDKVAAYISNKKYTADYICVSAGNGCLSAVGMLGVIKSGYACKPVTGADAGTPLLETGDIEAALRSGTVPEKATGRKLADRLFILGRTELSKAYLARLVAETNDELAIDRSDRFYITQGENSFKTIYTLLGALSSRASIEFLSESSLKSIGEKGVTVLNCSVNELRDIICRAAKNNIINTVRHILITGYSVEADLIHKIREICINADITLFVPVNGHEKWFLKNPVNIVSSTEPLAGGFPMDSMKSVILNYEGDICPAGVAGTLHLFGDGQELTSTGMKAVMKRNGLVELESCSY